MSERDEGPKRIQRKRARGWGMPENTVYVGRPTEWGNPFYVGVQTEFLAHFGRLTVEQSVEMFRLHIGPMGSFEYDNEKLNRMREQLASKNLACWCPLDQPCHADVLLEIANEEPKL